VGTGVGVGEVVTGVIGVIIGVIGVTSLTVIVGGGVVATGIPVFTGWPVITGFMTNAIIRMMRIAPIPYMRSFLSMTK
jgi:hypothetical protein